MRLSDSLSLYPRLAAGLTWVDWEVRGSSFTVPSDDGRKVGPWIAISAPVLYHATPRFFLGAGPAVYLDFTQHTRGPGGRQQTIAAAIYTGGWWGWGRDDTPRPDPATPYPARARRFGEARQTVLSNEMSGGISSTSRPATGTSVAMALRPSVDRFVADDISLGITGLVDYASRRGRPDLTRFGIGPRAGLNVALASRLSFYPRVTAFVGAGSDAPRENTFLVLSAYAPLLVHLAAHVFVGFGPSLDAEVLRRAGASSFGADLVVGGWL